jgi:membrane protein
MTKTERKGRLESRLYEAAATSGAFSRYIFRRFFRDGCFAASGALSYATLVSLVPLGVIALGALSAIPILSAVRDKLFAVLFRYFVPTVGEQAAGWARTFAESAMQSTAISIAGIAVTGVMLLVTVEDQLNLIWRVSAPRPWVQRVLAYWTLITLGPVLIGVSLSLSTYFEIAAQHGRLGQKAAELITSGSTLHVLARATPPLLEFVAFTLLYCVIPNCVVRWRDGALGALVATVAIEILKVGFSIYMGAVSYYRTVYGTLATIPIFLLWMYISWMAVLLGAVVAAALPNWRVDERVGDLPAGGVRLGFSLALIAALARAQRHGETRSTPALAADFGIATTVIDEHMRPLAAAGFVAQTQSGSWVLAWDPASATLRDLYEALRLPLAGHWTGEVTAPWQRQIAPAMDLIVRAEAAAMQTSIADLLAEIGELAPQRRNRLRRLSGLADRIGSK